MIQRDTHAALISEAQAKALITQLASSDIGRAVSRGKQAVSNALLAGKLLTEDGQPWVAHAAHYRLRRPGAGKLVRASVIGRAVIEQLRADCESEIYLAQLVAAVKQQHQASPTQNLEARIRKLERGRDDELGAVVRQLTVASLRDLLADQDPAMRIQPCGSSCWWIESRRSRISPA